MAPWYMSDRVKLILTLTVLLMLVILTTSTKQYKSKKTERNSDAVRNVGIKLCQLKCAHLGQCRSLVDDIVILTCRLSRDESKIRKKKAHAITTRSHSQAPTVSCTSGMCSSGKQCMETRSRKEVCVHASTAPSPNTVSAAPLTTQDLQATPSPATDRDICHASKDGDLERVKQILAAGQVDINMRAGYYSWTPVMWAAQKGHSDVVEFLVGRGADVSLVDKFGNNVLHAACAGGDLKTVKLILSLNVLDINARNNHGKTAVSWARLQGHPRVLDLLVSHGAH